MKTLVTRRQAFAATYALTLDPFTARAAEREKVVMQLILAVDVSGSVNETPTSTPSARRLSRTQRLRRGPPCAIGTRRWASPRIGQVTAINS